MVYKLAPKAMVNRLKMLLHDLISHRQSIFILERLIRYNALVAFELFHAMKRKREVRIGTMAFKFDMSKVYN